MENGIEIHKIGLLGGTECLVGPHSEKTKVCWIMHLS